MTNTMKRDEKAPHAAKAIRIGSIGQTPVYRVTMSDSRTLTMTVPPSACRACGGEGCARCAASDGYEP